MTAEDEAKALIAELELLQADASKPQPDGQAAANTARQTAIKARLTELGHPLS